MFKYSKHSFSDMQLSPENSITFFHPKLFHNTIKAELPTIFLGKLKKKERVSDQCIIIITTTCPVIQCPFASNVLTIKIM
jgi:hypothetical protein